MKNLRFHAESDFQEFIFNFSGKEELIQSPSGLEVIILEELDDLFKIATACEKVGLSPEYSVFHGEEWVDGTWVPTISETLLVDRLHLKRYKVFG